MLALFGIGVAGYVLYAVRARTRAASRSRGLPPDIEALPASARSLYAALEEASRADGPVEIVGRPDGTYERAK